MSISRAFQEVLEEGDLFFPLRQWPPIAKEYMLKLHKNRNERYYLMRFLVYNGLSPTVASNWIMREGTYDDSAKRDQAGMIQKSKSQDFFRMGSIFNMRYGRTDTWNAPPPETSPWDQPPPEGYFLERPAPPKEEHVPSADELYDMVVDKYPRPLRSKFSDPFDFHEALALWRVESRRYMEHLKKSLGVQKHFP